MMAPYLDSAVKIDFVQILREKKRERETRSLDQFKDILSRQISCRRRRRRRLCYPGETLQFK